jgi:hypothetical protein
MDFAVAGLPDHLGSGHSRLKPAFPRLCATRNNRPPRLSHIRAGVLLNVNARWSVMRTIGIAS